MLLFKNIQTHKKSTISQSFLYNTTFMIFTTFYSSIATVNPYVAGSSPAARAKLDRRPFEGIFQRVFLLKLLHFFHL